jgi:hypothetical protein
VFGVRLGCSQDYGRGKMIKRIEARAVRYQYIGCVFVLLTQKLQMENRTFVQGARKI